MRTRAVDLSVDEIREFFGEGKAGLIDKYKGICFMCEEAGEEVGVMGIGIDPEHPKFIKLLFFGTKYRHEDDYLEELIIGNMLDTVEEEMGKEGYLGITRKTLESEDRGWDSQEMLDRLFFVETSKEARVYIYLVYKVLSSSNFKVVENNWSKFSPYVKKLQKDDILLKKFKGKKDITGLELNLDDYISEISSFYISENEIKTALVGYLYSPTLAFYPTVYMKDGEEGSKLIPALMYESFNNIQSNYPKVDAIAIEGFADNVFKGMEVFLGEPYETYTSRDMLRIFEGVDISKAIDIYLGD